METLVERDPQNQWHFKIALHQFLQYAHTHTCEVNMNTTNDNKTCDSYQGRELNGVNNNCQLNIINKIILC